MLPVGVSIKQEFVYKIWLNMSVYDQKVAMSYERIFKGTSQPALGFG